MRQVLINLVGNAIKYNAAEGRVELLLEPVAGSPPTVGIVVRDDGPGIAPERQHLLFQPFNRLGAQGGVVPGHGLGLAISQQLAEAMQGTLELRSTPGVGTEAVLRLPLAHEAAVATTVTTMTDARAHIAEAAVRVLCIEDNPVNALLMREALALRPGEIELRMAGSGEQGLEVRASWLPDLVLLDMSLPGIDGHEVLRRMRAQPNLSELPCVAVSADAMPHQIALARTAGFDDYWVSTCRPRSGVALRTRAVVAAPSPGRDRVGAYGG